MGESYSYPLVSRQQAIAFVHDLEKAVNSHDTARLLEFYSEDAVAVSPVFERIVGHSAIGESWNKLFSLFPDWTVSISDVLVDGDRIAFLGTAGATDLNGWFGQAPTGERVDYRAAIVMTIGEGKIVSEERIYDLTGVLRGLEKTRLDKELKLAAELQRVLLPQAKRVTSYCEAVGDSIPCRAIGGDLFELVHLPSGDFGVALGDVAGKGPASAILAAMIQGMLAVEVQTESSPSAMLSRLNRSLAGRNLEPRFATLVYGILSPNGRFVYSNAGHNPPILLAGTTLRRLVAGGPVLGAFSESKFEEEEILLSERDTLILFSDGVTDARDVHDQEFGEDRLISCVAASAADTAVTVLRKILSSVQDFCQATAQTDDITVAVTQFRHAMDSGASE
jgi:ketosteroid isomerase-like protein